MSNSQQKEDKTEEYQCSANLLENMKDDCLDSNSALYPDIKNSVPIQTTPEDHSISMLFRLNPLKPKFDEIPKVSLSIELINLPILKMWITHSGNTVNLSDIRLREILALWKKDKQRFDPEERDELEAEVAITNQF